MITGDGDGYLCVDMVQKISIYIGRFFAEQRNETCRPKWYEIASVVDMQLKLVLYIILTI